MTTSSAGPPGAQLPPPTVNALYFGTTAHIPKPDSSIVEVYSTTAPPSRLFEVIGTIEVFTENDVRTHDNMLWYAKQAARKMGGDVLLNLDTSQLVTQPGGTSGSTTAVSPYSDFLGNPVTTTTNNTYGATVRRILKAQIAVWVATRQP